MQTKVPRKKREREINALLTEVFGDEQYVSSWADDENNQAHAIVARVISAELSKKEAQNKILKKEKVSRFQEFNFFKIKGRKVIEITGMPDSMYWLEKDTKRLTGYAITWGNQKENEGLRGFSLGS